ncbi:D-glycero-alpha-D-manno-heptose-1,7-bisphosphate 7-phosphatase [Haematospirillum jordaniae]|nr:HAD family hydrolase [Haematospirillum jordaniae]
MLPVSGRMGYPIHPRMRDFDPKHRQGAHNSAAIPVLQGAGCGDFPKGRAVAARYIMLDRDGTLNVDVHYLSDPDDLCLEQHAVAGLKALAGVGFRFVVLTNQSGIARGLLTPALLSDIHARLDAILALENIVIDGYFFCPHGPSDECMCRKPMPGLALEASRTLGFDPSASWMIGDKAADIGLGQAVGAGTVLVRTGKGIVTEAEQSCRPDLVADHLLDAARLILARESS